VRVCRPEIECESSASPLAVQLEESLEPAKYRVAMRTVKTVIGRGIYSVSLAIRKVVAK
jgi:hypothetical protein